jgi:glycosyltransferase involved in cell wall biosynthesis
MHIRYVSNSTLGSGAANTIHVLRMCEAFAQIGHHPVLHCFHPETGPMPADRIAKEYGLADMFPIVQWHRPTSTASRLAYASRATSDRSAPESAIIYTRDLVVAAWARAAGRRFTLESHAAAFRSGIAHRALFRWICSGRTMQRLVVVSRALKDWYVDNGVAASRIVVAPDGAPRAEPSSQAAPRDDSRAAAARIVVGYAGSLNPGKGMEVVLPAAALLGHRSDLLFRIVGGSPEQVAYWRKGLRTEANVEFVGHVAPGRVAAMIRDFDLCLLPNQNHVVGHGGAIGDASSGRDIGSFTSPLKLFEYMSHGRAIIASDLPVLREVIDERCAVFAPPDDPSAWAGAVERLADDPGARATIGRRARDLLETRYTWQARASHVV